jgi:hypothetical protein
MAGNKITITGTKGLITPVDFKHFCCEVVPLLRMQKYSRPIILHKTPSNYRPIVQVIDNFERNHKLGLLFEFKLGRGRILICPIDLLTIQNQPEARQFLYSLISYIDSEQFDPMTEIEYEDLRLQLSLSLR